jgi:hypothetical protein
VAQPQRSALADGLEVAEVPEASSRRGGSKCGVNAHLKVPCLVAGMIGRADGIDDMNLPRHWAMPALFGGVRAPSTLGSFLRSFTWGNVWLAGAMTGHLGYEKHDPAGRGSRWCCGRP